MKRTVLLQFTSLSTILLQYSEPPAVLCNIKYCNILAVKYILTKACIMQSIIDCGNCKAVQMMNIFNEHAHM
jgi:hypothetical protein